MTAQPSLFAEQEAAEREQERAEDARRLAEWHDDHFREQAEAPGTGCQVRVEERTEGAYTRNPEHFYRGACFGCDWKGPERHGSENVAVEDAHDHAWPGWRDLPAAPDKPSAAAMGDKKALARWHKQIFVIALGGYPPGWVERGGAPIVTVRTPPGTRHVDGSSPWGGYDMARLPEGWEGKCWYCERVVDELVGTDHHLCDRCRTDAGWHRREATS